jgi:hypothetical protein
LTDPNYFERLQGTPPGLLAAQTSTPGPLLFVLDRDFSPPAHAGGSEHEPSPPTQTIDPNLLRPQPPPVPQIVQAVVLNYIKFSDWLRTHSMEPTVGDRDQDVPGCASQLALPGCSLFECFIMAQKQNRTTKYKCVLCNHVTNRIDRALEHQRSKWDHKPFLCPREWRVNLPFSDLRTLEHSTLLTETSVGSGLPPRRRLPLISKAATIMPP